MKLRSTLNALGSTLLLLGAVGCGSADAEPAAVSQTLEITATEYAFAGEPATITAGETIRFVLVNAGELDHEMQLLNADGRILGQIERLAPGASGSVEINFEEAGTYVVICDIDDHQSRGQRAPVVVEA